MVGFSNKLNDKGGGTPTLAGEKTFIPGMESEMAKRTAIRLGTFLSVLGNDQLPISPETTALTVQTILANFSQESSSRITQILYIFKSSKLFYPL